MKALFSHCQNPILPPKSSFYQTPNYFYFKRCHFLKPQIKKLPLYSSISAACYNGWDELMIRVDSDELGESNYIKRLILLLGFDDKKYFFIWVVGFVSALVVSRVRVSSLVVFPSIAIVFGVGFSFGLLNSGPKLKPNNGLGFVGPKKESLRVLVNRLRSLVELFDGFDVKVGELKGEITNAIEFEAVGVSDLEGYVNVVESFGVFVANARNTVEDCIDGIVVDDRELRKNLVYKNGRKSKETRSKGFDLFGFVGRFLNGNRSSSKLSELGFLKRDAMTKEMSDRTRESLQGSTVSGIDYREKTKLDDVDPKTVRNVQNGGMNNEEVTISSNRFLLDGRFSYQNFRYVNYRGFSSNMSAYRETRRWLSDESTSGDIEFDLGERHLESDVFLNRRKNFGNKFRGAYEHNEGLETNSYASFMDSFREERVNVNEDQLHLRKYLSQQENGSSSFSSFTVSDDMMFDKCLKNAKDLLKQAKECLEIANNEMLAEDILHESAQLLSQAVAMKPLSLLAISQLGNTYFLHGELKLRNSRELRRILSKGDDFVPERSNLLDPVHEMLPNRERISNLFVNACVECETLLVEAGRKYRTALAIDGHDLTILYNWGLSLCYRAQLIADIGPEAALDADKLFLAAIDKFDAMMSRSNAYAPQALYRWGAALQQRSRLRPSNSRDKVKLLQQAKTLYKDALDMGFDSLQVRKALSSCISELDCYGL